MLTNYLDDFLFIATTRDECDGMVRSFLVLCKRINCPVSQDKIEWGAVIITFLGTLLDGERHCLCISEEKRIKALNQIKMIKSKRKATIKEIQQLTGILNFLNRAIVPGRVFTRHMYSKIKTVNAQEKKLKQHHHVNLDSEFRKDASIWEIFLETAGESVICRPFTDRNMFQMSIELSFYTDASGSIGFGCFFDGRWIYGEWRKPFLKQAKPSIEFLELYALTVGVVALGAPHTEQEVNHIL